MFLPCHGDCGFICCAKQDSDVFYGELWLPGDFSAHLVSQGTAWTDPRGVTHPQGDNVPVLPGPAPSAAIEVKAVAPERWPGSPWSNSAASPQAGKQRSSTKTLEGRSHPGSGGLLPIFPEA